MRLFKKYWRRLLLAIALGCAAAILLVVWFTPSEADLAEMQAKVKLLNPKMLEADVIAIMGEPPARVQNPEQTDLWVESWFKHGAEVKVFFREKDGSRILLTAAYIEPHYPPPIGKLISLFRSKPKD
jgi:hypothetical protein